jgi:hypothetical protein
MQLVDIPISHPGTQMGGLVHHKCTHTKRQQEKEPAKKKVVDSTPHCSRVVPHPSTERAQTALTSVFG